MDLGLNGKVAAVTGGTKGIGEATVRALAREGAKVAVCARGADGLAAIEDRISSAGGEIATFQLDLGGDPAAADRFIEETVNRFGKLDILISAAGVHEIQEFPDISDADWQRTFDNNFFSVVRVCRAAIPHMQKQKWGRVVIVSAGSIHKQSIGWDVHPHYTSSKAAAANLAKFLSKQYTPDNILVNCILPVYSMKPEAIAHYAETARQKNISMEDAFMELAEEIGMVPPISRPGTPEEFADVIAFVASERASYLSGVEIPIDGGALDWP